MQKRQLLDSAGAQVLPKFSVDFFVVDVHDLSDSSQETNLLCCASRKCGHNKCVSKGFPCPQTQNEISSFFFQTGKEKYMFLSVRAFCSKTEDVNNIVGTLPHRNCKRTSKPNCVGRSGYCNACLCNNTWLARKQTINDIKQLFTM